MIEPEDDVPQRSVYEFARFEAWKHKWIESEKAHRDQGLWALYDWNRRFWVQFVRQCLIEHMTGRFYYREFERRYFRLFDVIPKHDPPCVDFVVQQFARERWENLCFATKSAQFGFTPERVRPVLEKLPVNETRLPPPRWEDN